MSNIFSFTVDNSDSRSMAHSFRQKRFAFFLSLLDGIDKGQDIKILDIGGTQKYWNLMGFDRPNVHITLLNLHTQPTTGHNFTSITGDATNISQYADQSFDIVYSNSVIEHLYTKENQIKMANEVQRVGKNYFIQTPNMNFPIEPHFVFPMFQFLPHALRVNLIQNFTLGHIIRRKEKESAEDIINEIHLLRISEMKQLFPTSKIYKEKFMGLTKSIVSYKF
jgi:2-polyprenyl-3-methyl-5-hydroxy-6-metoxy-1,4-benzoquinol methylase